MPKKNKLTKKYRIYWLGLRLQANGISNLTGAFLIK